MGAREGSAFDSSTFLTQVSYSGSMAACQVAGGGSIPPTCTNVLGIVWRSAAVKLVAALISSRDARAIERRLDCVNAFRLTRTRAFVL